MQTKRSAAGNRHWMTGTARVRFRRKERQGQMWMRSARPADRYPPIAEMNLLPQTIERLRCCTFGSASEFGHRPAHS